MKSKYLTQGQGNNIMYHHGGITRTLTPTEAYTLIKPFNHVFYSKRESIKYSIDSLMSGQIQKYILVINKYTDDFFDPIPYMGDAMHHLPTIGEEYQNNYSNHFLALQFTRIIRQSQ
jgi:hypothetical protein